jgi:cell wall-associated NlpC family hydrolase
MLDRRLHAFRPDLADIRLKGEVEAERYVEGEAAVITAPVVDVRPKPDPSVGIDTQFLFGEPVTVFETAGGWSWVQSEVDAYVGYVPADAVATDHPAATHVVSVPRTFLYPGPDLRFPIAASLSMGSRLAVVGDAETRNTRYLLLADGTAVIAAHCRPVGDILDDDPVAIAGLFLQTPYLWGGRSGHGIDCSALVQLSMQMSGRDAPRDSDMQSAFGSAITRNDLRRGDLVFWTGHVGFMEDSDSLLHANGHTMQVTREPLSEAIARIEPLYGLPTSYRRFY